MRLLGLGAKEVALFVRALLEAKRVEEGGPRAVEAARRRRLLAVLVAARRTRLYRPHLSEAAVREGRLDAVPPLEKGELLERLDESFLDPALGRAVLHRWVRAPENIGKLLFDRYLVAMTSGTTGQVGIFVNDLASWAETRGITFERIFRDRLQLKDFLRLLRYRRYRMAFVVATGGPYMTSLLASAVPPLGRLAAEIRLASVEMPVPALVAKLNAHRPHLLHSYPTVLELLCLEARSGRLSIDPEIITSGSEPLTPSCREAIAEAFPRAQLVETYAATECVPLATACRLGHLHVNEDACILEPIDEEGRLVPPGTLSDRVLLTNLLNRAQPLLRYTLADQVRLLSDPCACGSPFVRVEVQGRTDDTFFLKAPDGTFQAHPPIPLELIFLRVPGLLQYQLVHERQNHLRVLFASEPGAAGQKVAGFLDLALSRYLEDHGLLEAVSYTLEEVDRIERHAESHKVRQILSRVARPEAAAMSAQTVRERRRAPRRE